MNQHYDVVVVGGGIAGLTSAAYLCRYGRRTLLCEQSAETGGLVKTFWHGGFAFDAGIRAFENSGILFPMLRSLGIELVLSPSPASIGIGDRWVRLDSKESLHNYAAMLTALFPSHAGDVTLIADAIRRVMGYMDVLYGIENPLFLEDLRDLHYMACTLLPWLLRYQVNVRKASRLNEPVYDYLRRFTRNEALIDMVAQHFFRKTPAFFALSYFSLYLDYWYPKGGTGMLSQTLTARIRDAGCDVLTGARVTLVDARIHEIGLADGQRFGYGKLIWAADQKTLYAAVTDDSSVPAARGQRQLVERSTGGDSVLTLFLGTTIARADVAARCGAHGFYTPDTTGLSSLSAWQEAARHGKEALLAWVRTYLDRTTYEISCPALSDSSLAPEGQSGLIVSTLMDYEIVRWFADAGEEESFKQACTDNITEVFERTLFPNIRHDTLFSLCGTPVTIERETGNAGGAITGWAFTNETMPAEHSFGTITRSIETPIQDIVQCGQWTFSPSGMPVSILTGRLAADAVRKATRHVADT